MSIALWRGYQRPPRANASAPLAAGSATRPAEPAKTQQPDQQASTLEAGGEQGPPEEAAPDAAGVAWAKSAELTLPGVLAE